MDWTTLALGAAALVALVVALEFAAPQRMTRFWLALERRRAGLTLKRQTIAGGLEMPYLEGGRGEPLLLVHGFGGDKDNFTRLAGALTRRYRVIVPDLPGFGDATRDPGSSHAVPDQVRRLHEFVTALQMPALHLGGNSMGGFIAAEYAANHPQQVQSLWLLDPAGTAAAHDSPMVRHYLATGETPLLLRRPEDIGATLKAIAVRPPLLPPSVKTVLAQRAVADRELHSRILQQLVHESPTLEDRLPAVATPTLVVWGTEDRILDPGGAEALRLRLPRCRVVLMDGIGHVPMMEAPAATAAHYLRFRAELQAQAS
ncbi:MAG: alpha/beta fold hydrolase [Burkholderiales bacterium]|nr:alpha/beta fold hydrolase [Burkholderiales bacterium]